MRGQLPWALFILLVVGSCKKPTDEPLHIRVTRVVVSDGSEENSDGESPQQRMIATAAERGLRRAGIALVLDPAHSSPGDFQLRLKVQAESQPIAASKDRPETVRLHVLCAGMMSARQRGPTTAESGAERADKPEVAVPELTKLEHVGLTEKEFLAKDGPPTPAAVSALLERLVDDSAYTLGAQLHLLGSDSRALLVVASKEDSDAELRQTAIQILGRRKERLAVPVLIAIVRARTPEASILGPDTAEESPEKREAQAMQRALRDTAIGALVEIGDKSAVRPLLDSVAFHEQDEMGKIVEAVATLGGDEAKSYLQFVSKSHPEPAIRDEAEKALHRLEQRASAEASKTP
jgi:hypothetical protein